MRNLPEFSKSFPPLLLPSPATTRKCWKALPRNVPEFAKPRSNSRQRNPVAAVIPPELAPLEFVSSEHRAVRALPTHRSSYEAWTLVLGSLVILAAIAVSFLIGSRIGWLRSTASRVAIPQSSPAAAIAPATTMPGRANQPPSKGKSERSSKLINSGARRRAN